MARTDRDPHTHTLHDTEQTTYNAYDLGRE